MCVFCFNVFLNDDDLIGRTDVDDDGDFRSRGRVLLVEFDDRRSKYVLFCCLFDPSIKFPCLLNIGSSTDGCIGTYIVFLTTYVRLLRSEC